MKKIGIITITRDENYGNRLQNYAVQEVINKLGFTAETIINTTQKGFHSKKTTASYINKLSLAHILKVLRTRTRNYLLIKNDNDGLIKSLFWKLKFKYEIDVAVQKRKAAFNRFNTANIKFSNSSISMDKLDSIDIRQYEFFLCGSDQVWNPYYPQNSMIDFLCFAPEEKRVAFAPSFGVNHIPEYKKESFKDWLLHIPFLSIREAQGATIIKELTGREAAVLVDPTLMLSKDEWLAIAKQPEIDIYNKYILTYFLGNETKAYLKAINDIANSSSCEIINLANMRELESYAVDPGEFIYLINNAALVCTDSFHGAVFSMIMNTPFIVFDRIEDGHSMNSRLENFLTKFGVENRTFGHLNNCEDAFNMDFSNVDNYLRIEQNKAWSYLDTAFKQPVHL